jgi:formylglycine-generating enzyme required for sulfatase activity
MRGYRSFVRVSAVTLSLFVFHACDGGDGTVPSPSRKAADGEGAPAGTARTAVLPAGRPGTPPRVISPSAPTTPPAERPGMVFVPAGEFVMGRDMKNADTLPVARTPEHPWHIVHVDAFFIDKYEVTNNEYEAFTAHERDKRSPCDDCPVVRVTWIDAGRYCGGQRKRLPTEAEWEKAAKGGINEEPTPLGEHAWFFSNSGYQTHPVGQKKPNGYGAYDMLGNAREWTSEWYDPGYYRQGITRNPKGPSDGVRRVERGGAFFLSAKGVTTTIRYNHPPHFRLYFLGFRCAQDV